MNLQIEPMLLARRMVTLGLVAALGVNAATLTYQLLGQGGAVRTGPSAGLAAPDVGGGLARPAVSLSAARQAHLFGETGSAAMTAEPAQPAPVTRLNLKLTGVLAANDPLLAMAIISSNNGPERPYRVGDAIKGVSGVTVEAVSADHVVLLRNGKRETLKLPKDASVGSIVNAPARGGQPGRPGFARRAAAKPLATRLNEFRERVLSNPSALFSEVQIKPVMREGQVFGYEINSPQHEVMLRQAGLQKGDVVTQVNGIALNDPAKINQVFEQLKQAQRLNVTVNRNGVERNLNIDLH